jgi:hypothetical protein
VRLAVGIETGRGKKKRWRFLAGVHPVDGPIMTDDARMAEVFPFFISAATRVSAGGRGARVVDLDDLSLSAEDIARIAGGVVKLGEPGAPQPSKTPRQKWAPTTWIVSADPCGDGDSGVYIEEPRPGMMTRYICTVHEGTDHVKGPDPTRDRHAAIIVAAPQMLAFMLELEEDGGLPCLVNPDKGLEGCDCWGCERRARMRKVLEPLRRHL